jgi:hypothetical protein
MYYGVQQDFWHNSTAWKQYEVNLDHTTSVNMSNSAMGCWLALDTYQDFHNPTSMAYIFEDINKTHTYT